MTTNVLSGTNFTQHIALNTTLAAWQAASTSYMVIQGTNNALVSSGTTLSLYSNTYFDGTTSRALVTGYSSVATLDQNSFVLYWASTVSAGAATTLLNQFQVSLPTGNVFMSGDLTAGGAITVGTSLNMPAQPVNTVWAGPDSGGSAAPTFRALVAADLPLTPAVTYDSIAPTTTKGDLVVMRAGIYGNIRLAVGANNTRIIADSTAAAGIKWGEEGDGTVTALGTVTTTKTVAWTNAHSQSMTLTTATGCTLTFTAPGTVCWLTLQVISPASGTVPAITWPAAVKWASATKPVQATTLGRSNIYRFWFDGTYYWGDAIINCA